MLGAGPGTWLLARREGALLRRGHVNEIQLCKGGGSGRTQEASVGRGQSECQGPGVEGPSTAGAEHPEAKGLRSASWGRTPWASGQARWAGDGRRALCGVHLASWGCQPPCTV